MTHERVAPENDADAFRSVITTRLAELALVEAGHEPERLIEVTTTVGVVPMTSGNVQLIKENLRQVYASSFPELFDKKKRIRRQLLDGIFKV